MPSATQATTPVGPPNDYLESNPVADMLPSKTGPATKRLSFNDDQLKVVFTSPLFTTCRGNGWRDLEQPGNVAVPLLDSSGDAFRRRPS